MRLRNSHLFSIASVLFLCGGCGDSWMLSQGVFKSGEHGIRLETPQGWYERKIDDGVLLTRDGSSVQSIVVIRRSWGDTMHGLHKPLRRNSLLHETAQLYLDYVSMNSGWGYDLQVCSTIAVTIAAFPACRLEYTFKRSNGLDMKSITYCVPHSKGLYILDYTAPDRFFFERDSAAFEKTAESFFIFR